MRVHVRLFAGARQAAGAETLEVEINDPATVAELRAAMIRTCPALRPILLRAFFSVDAEYVGDDEIVSPQAQIACIPPVSGG